jgi:hypothetical protein
MTDELILRLVLQLEKGSHEPEMRRDDGYRFFVTDLWLESDPYRVVWVLPPDDDYLGVRTAFRRSK